MIVLHEPSLSDSEKCPYLPDKIFRAVFFIAIEVNAAELDLLLESGWRKFGTYYFRPFCSGCQECIPVRIPVANYVPSKSKKRIVKRNCDVSISYGPLSYSDELFEIFKEHSESRFSKTVSQEQFIKSNFEISCPSMLSKYCIEDKLVAAGFLDHSGNALSSVYFIFKNSVLSRGIGIFSIVKEIEYCQSQGLHYHYLGYYVPNNPIMAYKVTFLPFEYLDWSKMSWEKAATVDDIKQY